MESEKIVKTKVTVVHPDAIPASAIMHVTLLNERAGESITFPVFTDINCGTNIKNQFFDSTELSLF